MQVDEDWMGNQTRNTTTDKHRIHNFALSHTARRRTNIAIIFEKKDHRVAVLSSNVNFDLESGSEPADAWFCSHRMCYGGGKVTYRKRNLVGCKNYLLFWGLVRTNSFLRYVFFHYWNGFYMVKNKKAKPIRRPRESNLWPSVWNFQLALNVDSQWLPIVFAFSLEVSMKVMLFVLGLISMRWSRNL